MQLKGNTSWSVLRIDKNVKFNEYETYNCDICIWKSLKKGGHGNDFPPPLVTYRRRGVFQKCESTERRGDIREKYLDESSKRVED